MYAAFRAIFATAETGPLFCSRIHRRAYVTLSRRCRHPEEQPGLKYDVLHRWKEEQAPHRL